MQTYRQECEEKAERLPFEVKIPVAKPVSVAEMTEAELNAELERGYTDMTAGRTKPARQAFADIRKDNGI